MPTKPGSSPRVRGTERNIITEVLLERFIPAGAGNSDPVTLPFQA